MGRKEISIVIPTYNMEKLIGRCLDSLLIPELDKVEILVVNDGSNDLSSEIAHSYAEKYPDSIKVIDKLNGNYGSCINAALPEVRGRYIKILDADDYFDTIAFSDLVNALSDLDDDAVVTNHVILDANNNILIQSTFPENIPINKSLTIYEAKNNVLSNYVQMHRLAYNIRIFKRFSYHQTVGVSYTDSQWSIIPLAYCKSIRCLDIVCYKYIMGREGQTMSTESLAKSVNNFFSVLIDTLDYYSGFKGDAISKQVFRKHFVQNHGFVYSQVLGNPNITNMHLLQKYDELLKVRASDIYADINHLKYDPRLNFCVFADIRDSHYPVNYHVPVIQLLKLSARVKLDKIRQLIPFQKRN